MQPYFFPYIGYFQLMHAVDIFVFHDDVQLVKGSWVNRNRILSNNKPTWLTLPIQRAEHTLNINQRNYLTQKASRNRILRQIESAYNKAPYFKQVFPEVKDLLEAPVNNVAYLNKIICTSIARFIGINCRFRLSSHLVKDDNAKGQARVINICNSVGAHEYVNPIGGVSLYHEDAFRTANITLKFLKSDPIDHEQIRAQYAPLLSIIDVLMFNNLAETNKCLDRYHLISSV